MYVTEAMIQSMEEMNRNAGDMEKSIKAMMETEGRMHGVELDRRHSARDMWAQLMVHMQTEAPTSSMMTEVAMPVVDPNMHMHEDGSEHSHDDGNMVHDHADPAMAAPVMDTAMEPTIDATGAPITPPSPDAPNT